ncbi:hypothetical protein BJ122_11729 [Rhodopseudomonas faecalis]|uniref:Uncharacterized protein n=1 Tax=Rhodopseudomonas faecalis TaxID=99655 RepID=A0A318TB41_9BRAD|nr:hypothetical protein BJ122_11729 [Rhodopseudomonas faecalis]
MPAFDALASCGVAVRAIDESSQPVRIKRNEFLSVPGLERLLCLSGLSSPSMRPSFTKTYGMKFLNVKVSGVPDLLEAILATPIPM